MHFTVPSLLQHCLFFETSLIWSSENILWGHKASHHTNFVRTQSFSPYQFCEDTKLLTIPILWGHKASHHTNFPSFVLLPTFYAEMFLSEPCFRRPLACVLPLKWHTGFHIHSKIQAKSHFSVSQCLCFQWQTERQEFVGRMVRPVRVYLLWQNSTYTTRSELTAYCSLQIIRLVFL